MAKGGKDQVPKKRSTSWQGPTAKFASTVFSILGDAGARAVERLGWPGFVFLLGYLFVERNGTPAQKQQIIDVFVLGKGISDTYPMVAMAAVSVCVILAQRSIYKRRTAVLSGEVDRLSAWKTAHQEKEIGDVLHHSRQEGNR